MRNGGLILWNAVAICEISKTFQQMGKLRMKEDLENHSKDNYFLLEPWLNIFDALIGYLPNSERENSSILQESMTCYLSWV